MNELDEIYEMFLDISYFDTWCVRNKNNREFEEGFHLYNEGDALRLKNLLNYLYGYQDLEDCRDTISVLSDEIEKLKEQIKILTLENLKLKHNKQFQ